MLGVLHQIILLMLVRTDDGAMCVVAVLHQNTLNTRAFLTPRHSDPLGLGRLLQLNPRTNTGFVFREHEKLGQRVSPKP